MAALMVVCYDIADDRRRLKVSKLLENYGRRVQKSIFECRLDGNRQRELQNRMGRLIKAGQDQVVYYVLCPKDEVDIKLDGAGDVLIDLPFYLI